MKPADAERLARTPAPTRPSPWYRLTVEDLAVPDHDPTTCPACSTIRTTPKDPAP